MIAFCGMAAALSLVIMLIGGIIPAATYQVKEIRTKKYYLPELELLMIS